MSKSTTGRHDRTGGEPAFSLLRSGLGGRLTLAAGMVAGLGLMLLAVV